MQYSGDVNIDRTSVFKAVNEKLNLYFCWVLNDFLGDRRQQQGRIQKYGLGGREGVGSRPLSLTAPST